MRINADGPATLFLGSALVGPLPIDIGVEPSAKVYTVRATGFTPQDVVVAESSPDQLMINLVHEVGKASPTTHSRAPATTAPTVSAVPAPTTQNHGGSEFYDPWK